MVIFTYFKQKVHICIKPLFWLNHENVKKKTEVVQAVLQPRVYNIFTKLKRKHVDYDSGLSELYPNLKYYNICGIQTITIYFLNQ